MSALMIAAIQLRLASDWLEKHAVYLDGSWPDGTLLRIAPQHDPQAEIYFRLSLDAYKLMEGCGIIEWVDGQLVMYEDHPLFAGVGDED